jgi:N-acetylmuramoyl-L-alanine amidase
MIRSRSGPGGVTATLALWSACACVAVQAAALGATAADSATAAPGARSPHIVVDTGHTPQHPGATGASGRVEYQYNLDLSTAIVERLSAARYRVTRVAADGLEIALKDRATRTPDADLFVSIHHDSMQQAWIDAGRRREFAGYSIFVSEKNPQYAHSLRCARAVGEALSAAGQTPSLYHATPIPGENRPLIDARLSIHRFDDLVVLKTAPMPAILIEAGVIANPDDEARVSQPETIQRLADAIAAGIQGCQTPA